MELNAQEGKKKVSRVIRSSLAAVGMLVLSACGSPGGGGTPAAGDTTGVTADSITMGFLAALSGPSANPNSVKALNAALGYWNAKGGVNGRQLKLIYRDATCTNTQTGVAAARQMIESDKVFGFWAQSCPAVAKAVNDTLLAGTKVFNMAGTAGASNNPNYAHPNYAKEGYTLYTPPSSGTQLSIAINFAMTKLDPKPSKVAIYAQNDAYGNGGVVGAQASLPKFNLSLVDTERVENTATNASVEMARIKASGADTVLVSAYPSPASAAYNAALQLDYHPYFISAAAGLGSIVAAAVPAAGIAKLYGPPSIATTWADGSKAGLDYIAQYQPYAGDYKLISSDAFVIGQTEILVQYLKRAGKNLTREAYLNAVFAGPITTTPFGQLNIPKASSPEVNRQMFIEHYVNGSWDLADPKPFTPAAKIPGIDA